MAGVNKATRLSGRMSPYLKNDSEFKGMDYFQMMKDRCKKLKVLQGDRRLTHSLKVFYEKNPIEFIEDWILTHDPRAKNIKTMPFILFKRQREFINWLLVRVNKQEDGVVEKCREMGATHLSIAFMIWMFLFKKEVSIGIASLKADRADKLGDTDSFLEKGRGMLRLLPKILLPVGFDVEVHCRHMLFRNPQNGSIIFAESGKDIGRGRRSTMYFKDESDFYEQAEKIDAALSQTSRCKIDISTINKINSPFYRKRHSGNYPVFVMDWREDPRKGAAWYAEQKKMLDPLVVQKEIDRDWGFSDDDVCIEAKWVQEAVREEIPSHVMESGEPIIAGLDIADSGNANNVLVIRKGSYVLHVFDWKSEELVNTARRAFMYCQEHNVEYLNYDGIGVGAAMKNHFEIFNEKAKSKLVVNNINVGMPPPKNREADRFRNLKAYLWFSARTRFRKVYEMHTDKEIKYEEEELVFIPKHYELIKELSMVHYSWQDNGSIIMESKKKMPKSPDFADAFMLAYHVVFKPFTFELL